jgi:hypothetical protein
MKKIITIFISACLILVLGYLTYNQLNPKYVEASASIDYLQNFSELEKTSELIAEVTATGYTNTFLEIDQYNMPSYGYNLTTVKVNKIYKAPEGFSDKILRIVEPCFEYTSVIGEKIVICFGDYRPLKDNKTYLLFLNKYHDKGYQINNSAQGKYLLSEKLSRLESIDEFTSDDFEMGRIIENYTDFYREAKTKYK